MSKKDKKSKKEQKLDNELEKQADLSNLAPGEVGPGEEHSVEETEPKTGKKYLKQAEKVVRKLDNIVSDLHNLSDDTYSLQEGNVTEIAPRDEARFAELHSVITASVHILYALTERMARKYVGTSVAQLYFGCKRKSLKK